MTGATWLRCGNPVTKGRFDRRYSLNIDKIRELDWTPRHDFDAALEKTVRWYVDNEWWWRTIRSGEHYRDYYQAHYSGREM